MGLTFAAAADKLDRPFPDAGTADVVAVIKERVVVFGRAGRSAAA